MLKNRLPSSTFPIATDPFGNLFIMSIFRDHEGEPEFQDGHDVDNCSFLAYTFSEFKYDYFRDFRTQGIVCCLRDESRRISV